MRLKTLNGAPLSRDLDFSEETLLEYKTDKLGFCKVLEPGLGLRPSNAQTQEEISIKWRHLEPRNSRLRTGWSQPYIPGGGVYTQVPHFTYSFIPNADGSFDSVKQTPLWDEGNTTHQDTFAEEPGAIDGFNEHSLFLHQNMQSSQIAGETSAVTENDTFISSTSFLTTSFNWDKSDVSDPTLSEIPRSVLQLPPNLTLTPLSNIPSAQHLNAIYPQTPTPTFLAVLTDDLEQREVSIRKGGYKMMLYEITVADHTHSGFKISFWFRPNRKPDAAQQIQRHTLEELKIGDVLLLRNIVLHTFRDTVSGQSLNSNISRAKTTVEVVSKADGSFSYARIIPVAADEHFVRVKKWAKNHVATPQFGGVGRKRKGGAGEGERLLRKALKTSKSGYDDLPPDTMESV